MSESNICLIFSLRAEEGKSLEKSFFSGTWEFLIKSEYVVKRRSWLLVL